MALKVAILGFSPSRKEAPWKDDSWQLWGMAWDIDRFKFHRVFEMHDMKDMQSIYGDRLPAHLENISYCENVYMAEPLWKAKRFPFEDVADDVGDYWVCSISYMLSMAIHEKADEIALYGIDANDDYGYQRPNLEYLIGFARGRGIRVHIPDSSPLCKWQIPDGWNIDGRYGRSK